VEGIPLHKPSWQVYRPECREWIEAGTVNVKGVGRLDHSPPSRKPHLEYDRKELAVSAVNFPLVLENIEGKIDFLTENVCRLVDSVGKLSDALGKLFDLEGKAEGNTVSGKGVQDYVS
jgi:predicted component of type VI protein secretion system